jgi:hypothetical protein
MVDGSFVNAPSTAERILRGAWRDRDSIRFQVDDDGRLSRIELP